MVKNNFSLKNKIYFLVTVSFFILIMSFSLLWNIYTIDNNTAQLVKNIGRSFFKEIETTRLWNARHGGVYVPITENTQSNPYLKVPGRDITSTQGLKLTLINPAFMTRQISEIAITENNIQYHITSLKPIRPQNRADEWESKALAIFANGGSEYTEYIEDKVVYRYMAPLFVKHACLKCHKTQGYKVGDIRGGISVTIPAKVYIDTSRKSKIRLAIIHLIFLLVGVIGLYMFRRFRDRHLVILSKTNIKLENEIVVREQAENRVKTSLKEKETLLQEIHHRVKNNMAVISSLLKLKLESITDKKAKEALQDSQNRVQTMSMIHETLYRSDNLAAIEMQTYLSELGRIILQGYSVGKINLDIESENILIGVKQASPLGLIVNELITNSCKYAFPEMQESKIKISLRKIEGQIELIYSDNGIGMPEDFSWKNSNTLGLSLVRTLIENQLDGSIDMENKNGTKFIIKFNLET